MYISVIGARGQVVQSHAATVFKPEQELVLTIRQTLVSHLVNKKVATFKNAAMPIGEIGEVGTHVQTVVSVHIKNNVLVPGTHKQHVQ